MAEASITTIAALEEVRYDKVTGLVPVVVQDVRTSQLLMLAYANREALKRTFGTGEAWFWSRSRQAYWHKGATSGNVQRVVEIRADCDGDSVLYLVEPAGPACHTGQQSCFYRRLQYKGENPESTSAKGAQVPDRAVPVTESGQPAALEAGSSVQHESRVHAEQQESESVLQRLWQTIDNRWQERPQGSYTTYLFEHGIDKVAKKLGEEGVEVVLAAKNAVSSAAGKVELAEESADLLFHLFAVWRAAGIAPDDVYRVLSHRER